MQQRLEVRQTNALVDRESLDLVEDRRMRLVRVARNTRPSEMIFSGAPSASIDRIWTGEVCVLSSLPDGR